MFRAIHYRTLNIGFLYYSSFRGKNYMPQHLLLFERERELSATLFTVRAKARTPPKKAGQATTLVLISGAGSSR